MSTNFPFFLSAAREELQTLRRYWGWFLVLGIALIVVGLTAILSPVWATLTTVEIFGYLLVIGGLVEMVSSFWGRGWRGVLLHLLGGLLYFFVGVVMIERPGLTAAGYTLLLAMYFVAGGLFRVIFTLSQRFAGWGWTLLSGAVSFLLGVMIWRGWPVSAFWVIGTFVGIDLIVNGWSWVMLGLGLRQLPMAPSGLGPVPTSHYQEANPT